MNLIENSDIAMDADEEVCDKHRKQYEMFCCKPGCEGVKKPMCSMCMCEHLQEKHSEGATHISRVVQTDLAKLEHIVPEVGEQQALIKAHQDKVGDYLQDKKEVDAQIEDGLQNLLKIYNSQKDIAATRNTAIMKCRENVLKAIKKCEHKIKDNINDPTRVKRQVNSMLGEQKYWRAYREVTRALTEDTKLDDSDIKKEFQNWEGLKKDYKSQVAELNMYPQYIAEYKRTHDMNAELTSAQQRLTSNYYV